MHVGQNCDGVELKRIHALWSGKRYCRCQRQLSPQGSVSEEWDDEIPMRAKVTTYLPVKVMKVVVQLVCGSLSLGTRRQHASN